MGKITVSCIGLGCRAVIYLSLMNNNKDVYNIVSFCDLLENKLDFYSKEYNVNKNNCFIDEDEFFKTQRADLCLIMAQDESHARHILKALKCGYKKILVEKPFCTNLEDINLIEKEAKKNNAEIYVCHVLRYAAAFVKAKELIDEGKIGKLISIDALERVGYAHFSHSYVRGHYAVKEKSSPSIMAKCCHDLDLLVWYADSLCESINSYGGLSYFKKENAPKESADRCCNCKLNNRCYFSTDNIYFKALTWAKEYATYKRPVTDEVLKEELKVNQFGRCVYKCDNNVCDEQHVSMIFKNSVVAHLEMTAFTPLSGRRYAFRGTEGNIILDEYSGELKLTTLDGTTESYSISTLVDSKAGHGGGDKGIIDNLTKVLLGQEGGAKTTIEYALESHKMALYAEESRLKNGMLIKL